ncbi:MAG: class I adenylate-forming enzyme family protein [Pseudomonadota bacterium]
MHTACPAPFNLAAYVLAAGACEPDKVALRLVSEAGAETWSYGALIAAVRGAANGLRRAGLMPGARVLLRLGNTPDFPVAYLACLAAGLVPVPTSAALTAPEVARLISVVQPQVVLRDPLVPCPSGSETLTLEAFQEMCALPPAPYHMGDPNRLGYIIFTSGTSGTPTAVMHAHRAIWARRMMFDGWYGLTRAARVLHAGAFNWTYTLGTGLMDPWTLGATALIPAPGTPAGALPALLKAEGATIFAAAPGVYRQMLRGQGALDLPELSHGLSAGEKMADTVKTAWTKATGTPIYEAFGMSECSTFISGAPGRPARRGTIGAPQIGRRVSLRVDGVQAAPGSPGTIAIHRSDPGLMLGYLDAPEETAARFEGDWFLTGDQGAMDADGHITFLGRDDDMMNAGGFRVSPLEVEGCLARAPGITGVGVAEVTVKDGVRVMAAFFTADTPLDTDALAAYAQGQLARYKQPRLYVQLDALPHSGNGKLSRGTLRKDFEAKTP